MSKLTRSKRTREIAIVMLRVVVRFSFLRKIPLSSIDRARVFWIRHNPRPVGWGFRGSCLEPLCNGMSHNKSGPHERRLMNAVGGIINLNFKRAWLRIIFVHWGSGEWISTTYRFHPSSVVFTFVALPIQINERMWIDSSAYVVKEFF